MKNQIEIKQREGENRKDYLIRVAIAFLNEYSGLHGVDCVIYDEAECDGFCLADDLKNEFDIEDNE